MFDIAYKKAIPNLLKCQDKFYFNLKFFKNVYEWFIKETSEVFYVGKGRGDRYKEYHKYAYEAEKIRALHDTDNKFIATNLTESEAAEIESKEITRILNETTYRLTNRFTPLFADRDNGYGRSKNTPIFKFEVAPAVPGHPGNPAIA